MTRPAWMTFFNFTSRPRIGGGAPGAPVVNTPETSGPGTELIKIFAAKGVPGCQQCHELARKMDAWGPDGCRDRLSEIVDDILPRARQWSQSSYPFVASLFGESVSDAVLRTAIKSFATQAIRTAERQEQPPAFTIRKGRELADVGELDRLAIIAVHFNPQGYQRPRENYWKFREALGPLASRLWTTELSFDGMFYTDPTFALRGSPQHLCWQKEALINLTVARLPDEIEYIACIDADLIFDDPEWALKAIHLLQTNCQAVQLYRDVRRLSADGSLESKPRGAVAWQQLGGSGRCPGGAWMVPRSFFANGGLPDWCIVGGGDQVYSAAWTGQTGERFLRRMPAPMLQRSRQWITEQQANHTGSVGYLPSDVTHLWHGDVKYRQHQSRQEILVHHNFDPDRDLTRDEQGLIVLQDPQLIQAVAQFFADRKEDERSES